MSGPSDPTRDFVRAAEVRRAMMRAPWPPLALKLALLVFDYMGLERGRCELGLGSIAVALMSPKEFEALGALSGEVRAKRLRLAKRSLKRAAVQLGDVLVTETTGDGKRARRTLRTDLILARWGGDHRVTPSKNAGGGDAVTPTKHEGGPHGHQGGDDAVTPRGDRTVTSYQEDPKEDLVEGSPPARARPSSPIEDLEQLRDEVWRRWRSAFHLAKHYPPSDQAFLPEVTGAIVDLAAADDIDALEYLDQILAAYWVEEWPRQHRASLRNLHGQLDRLVPRVRHVLGVGPPPPARPGPASTRPRRVHRHAYNPEIGSDEDFAEAERLLATPKEIPRA